MHDFPIDSSVWKSMSRALQLKVHVIWSLLEDLKSKIYTVLGIWIEREKQVLVGPENMRLRGHWGFRSTSPSLGMQWLTPSWSPITSSLGRTLVLAGSLLTHLKHQASFSPHSPISSSHLLAMSHWKLLPGKILAVVSFNFSFTRHLTSSLHKLGAQKYVY